MEEPETFLPRASRASGHLEPAVTSPEGPGPPAGTAEATEGGSVLGTLSILVAAGSVW